MVDAYPSCASDADHAVQMLIDADLANADRMPTAVSAAQNQEWLMPLLRRLDWNLARGTEADSWTALLIGMLRAALPNLRQVSEQEFLALATVSDVLLRNHCFGYLECMSKFAHRLDKTAQLNPEVVHALRSLLNLCDYPRSGGRREMFVWPLFRAGTGYDSADTCWSARVRRDIAAMNPKLRNLWLRAFDCERNTIGAGGPLPTRASLTAAKQIGALRIAGDLMRWIGMLHDSAGPYLSPAGVIVFRHVITLCDLAGGTACDELLYDIARAPWAKNSDVRWIGTFLWAVGRRSQDHAFACLEALMMNPATATDAVQKAYDALMTVFSAAALPPNMIGVDGYPLDAEPRQHQQQIRIDQLLIMAADAAARGLHNPLALPATQPLPWFPVAPEVKASLELMQKSILEEYSADPASLYHALAMRTQWICAQEAEFPVDRMKLWKELLHGMGCNAGLLKRSLAPVEHLPLEALLDAVRTGGGNWKVVELCRDYVARHGWHADIVAALVRWIPSIGVSASSNSQRAHVEWFLWFEDVVPIQFDGCWSHRVKRDLRAMPPKEHAAWRALLDNNTFVISEKPPKKWLQAAEPAFLKVGTTDFRRRFVTWFEPFAKGEPLRLTITGRNILRLLMWYALIARDQEVDEALAGFAHVTWKNAEAARRAAQAEMAFSYVLSRLAPEIALPILERYVASGQAHEGTKTQRIYTELCLSANRQPIAATPAPLPAPKASITAGIVAMRLVRGSPTHPR
jgi:hypothetical protein